MIDIMHGACRCTDLWRKPLQRIVKHHQIYGPEVCPDCHEDIHWFKQTKVMVVEEE